MAISRENERLGSGRFELRAVVGEGAVGVVYDAFDHERGGRVAIKRLKSLAPDFLMSLKHEFRSLQDIRHPNLVSLGDLFDDHATWFFTMEFIEGVPFRRYARPGEPSLRIGDSKPPAGREIVRATPFAQAVDEERLRAALVQLARGVSALHDANIVHRDIKPSNVLVTSEGRVVILDFGVAGDLRALQACEQEMVGTGHYMAPEQTLGEGTGAAADWYSVGILLYESLTGTLPFLGSLEDITHQKLSAPVRSPSEVDDTVPADLARLCIDLLAVSPEARPTRDEILARLGAVADEPRTPRRIFVGRTVELGALDRAALDVVAGSSVTILVHGESGVGKSYLVRSFTDAFVDRAPEALVLAGRCYERESVRYKGVDGVIDALSRFLQQQPSSAREALLPEEAYLLADVFPVLADVRSQRPPPPPTAAIVNPHELRVHAFKTLRETFVRIAKAHDVVLVIDDIQWADTDSLALLCELMRPPGAPRILLVATSRIGLDVRVLDLPGDVRHLWLEVLPSHDARALATELAGTSLLDDHELQAVVSEANGHPLFIDELIRQRLDRGGSATPLRLDEALWERIKRLEPQTREVLEVIAVAGVPTAHDVIAEAAQNRGEVTFVTSILRAARLVRSTGSASTDAVEPYHDRVRESVLAHISADDKRRWHHRLAMALDARAGSDPQDLAVHWLGAGDATRAATYAERAGDDAARALAFDRASTQFELALSLGTPSGRAVRRLKTKLAEALTNARRYVRAAETRIELAGTAWDVEAIDLRRHAAEQFLCAGHFDRGVVLLRSVLAHLRIYYPVAPVLVVLSLLVARALLRLRGVGFVRRDPATADLAALVRVDALRSAGAGFAMTDNIRGAYLQTRALLAALRVGDANRLIHALSVDVCFTSAGGLPSRERTRYLLARARELAESLSTDFARACVAEAAGYAHYMVGEWGEASGALAVAEVLFRDRTFATLFELNSSRTMLYRALAYEGKLVELASRLGPALRDSLEIGDIQTETNLRASAMVFLALIDDAPDRAREELKLARAHLPQTSFLIQHYFCLLGEMQLRLYEGDSGGALATLEAQWSAVRGSMLLRVQTLRTATLEYRARARIAAALATGSPDHLRGARKDAAALARQAAGYALAGSANTLACIAHAMGERDAPDLFARAASLFVDAGMMLHAAVAQRRRGELLGGGVGRELVETSTQWMSDQGVRRGDALVWLMAPCGPHPGVSSRVHRGPEARVGAAPLSP